MTKYSVDETQSGTRLDVFVASELNMLSRAFLQKLIEQGRVTVNGEAEKPSYKLRAGDYVTIAYNPEEQGQIPDIDLPVLYEDDDCIVINKPAGVLTHSKGAFNPEGTVATFLLKKIQNSIPHHNSEFARTGLANEREGIVHRLDRATSGVIICAKHPDAQSWLQKQFSQRRVKKTYYAVITGTLDPAKAIIEMPIERNPNKPQTFRAGINGKPSVTAYEITETNGTHSLVELKPTTGRTHQIRVHLSQLKHPIVGDILYGGKPADRLYLHAQELEITLPNRERRVFVSPLPETFYEQVRS